MRNIPALPAVDLVQDDAALNRRIAPLHDVSAQPVIQWHSTFQRNLPTLPTPTDKTQSSPDFKPSTHNDDQVYPSV